MRSRPDHKLAPPQDQTGGLTLDDYLHTAADMRRTFKLAKPRFGLRDVESQPGASAAVKAIVDETIERHGSEIYAKQHELLDTLGPKIYGERTQSLIYSGHRISQDTIERVLRRTIEAGLQIAVQLPTQDIGLLSTMTSAVPRKTRLTFYPFKRFSSFTMDSMTAPNAGTSPNIIPDIASYSCSSWASISW